MEGFIWHVVGGILLFGAWLVRCREVKGFIRLGIGPLGRIVWSGGIVTVYI
jgi:hypothetical protein